MLTIVKFPDPILRETMPEFDFQNPIMDPEQLEKEMIEAMHQNGGVGLSANQVGIRTKMFVMGTGEKAMGFFNPMVVEADGIRDDFEGCLSFPEIALKVKRPHTIRATWQNTKGEWVQGEMSGLTAKCFLHEFDHLQGIVLPDRVSPIRWAMALKKTKKNQRKR